MGMMPVEDVKMAYVWEDSKTGKWSAASGGDDTLVANDDGHWRIVDKTFKTVNQGRSMIGSMYGAKLNAEASHVAYMASTQQVQVMPAGVGGQGGRPPPR